MNRKTILIIILAMAILAPTVDISNRIIFSAKGLDLLNVSLSKDHRGREIFRVSDLSYQSNTMPLITDLVLSFNRPARDLVRDDSGRYAIKSASFAPMNNDGTLGPGAASFYKRDHRIEIETERNIWLGSCTDLGSFSIEFRYYPVSLKDGGVIFSRLGYFSGAKNGIACIVKNNKVIAQFFGIFKDADGRRTDVFLNRGRTLKEKKWHHIVISFDRISGKLAKLVNGIEDEVHYLTISGEPYNGVFSPSFSCGELPLAIMGQNLYGYIDEFRISHRHIEDLKKETEIALKKYRSLQQYDRTPVNREGVITSPVYQFPYTGTMVKLFTWRSQPAPHTFIWMEFRTSDDLFDAGSPHISWYRITKNQRNLYRKKIGNDYLRGKYYQWRAHLVPSPDGKRSPALYHIRCDYQLDPPPKAPLFPEVIKTGDCTVRLRWKKNIEHDILGYKIYYGLQPRQYDGIITIINGKRITNGGNQSFFTVDVDITNDIINENKIHDTRSILNYPILKNNVLYFFAISAYDSYKPDSRYNHESALSTEVSGRPFAGSEIDE